MKTAATQTNSCQKDLDPGGFAETGEDRLDVGFGPQGRDEEIDEAGGQEHRDRRGEQVEKYKNRPGCHHHHDVSGSLRPHKLLEQNLGELHGHLDGEGDDEKDDRRHHADPPVFCERRPGLRQAFVEADAPGLHSIGLKVPEFFQRIGGHSGSCARGGQVFKGREGLPGLHAFLPGEIGREKASAGQSVGGLLLGELAEALAITVDKDHSHGAAILSRFLGWKSIAVNGSTAECSSCRADPRGGVRSGEPATLPPLPLRSFLSGRRNRGCVPAGFQTVGSRSQKSRVRAS